MATPATKHTTAGKRAPARTGPHPSFYPLLLVAAGIAAEVVRHATGGVRTANATQRQALDAARHALGLAGPWLIGAGVALGVLMLAWWAVRPRRPGDGHPLRPREVNVLAAAGAALRTTPDTLMLRRARWRRRRTLTRGRISYPAGTVVTDQAADLASALTPFITGPVAVTWHPHHNRFDVLPRGPKAERLEDRYPALRKLADRLSFLMGDPVVVDQQASEIDPATGAVRRLVATYATTTKDLGDGFRERAQYVLDAKAPSPTGYWSMTWNPERNLVTVTPAQPLPRLADYPLTTPAAADTLTIPVGVTEGGHSVAWRAETSPHMLLAGPTGGGKTSALNSVLVGATARGWDCYLTDPKELSFRGMIGWPGVRAIATTDDQMEAVIGDVYDRMRARYADLKVFAVRETDLTPVLLVVDEAGELVERLNAYQASEDKHLALIAAAIRDGVDPDTAEKLKKPTGAKNPELMKIWSLLRLGRQARVFVIVGTQRPDVTFIPGEARDNMRTRMALGSLSGAGLEMVFETRSIRQRVVDRDTDPATGLTTMIHVQGRATVGQLGAGAEPVQTFWVPDPAKVRTGELCPADVDRVHACYRYVVDHRAALGIDESRPAADRHPDTPPITRPVTAIDPRYTVDLDADLAAADTAPNPAELDTAGLPTIAARQLTPGMTVALDVDGRTTLATIEETEPDPADPARIEITYRVTGHDHAALGQAGVTTYDDTEAVPVLDDLPTAA